MSGNRTQGPLATLTSDPRRAAHNSADFDYDAQPGVDPALICDLASNRYFETATNIPLIGPSVNREQQPV